MTGYTITEIAEILKIPPQTVRVRLNRAGLLPLTKEAVYDHSVLNAIKDVKRGKRPKPKHTVF